MARLPISPTRTLASLTLGCLLAAAPALAGPGDPFGGDDTGCTPTTKLGLNCAKKTLATLSKLRKGVVSCHLKQEGLAFKTGHSSPGFSNAEENCELGPSNTSAKNKFDAAIAKLTASGCDATMLATAAATGAVLVSDQSVTGSLDGLNGTFFCDSASGATIDEPDGDDAGFIPSSPDHNKCEVAVAKAWVKLDAFLYKCHAKMASTGFAGTAFDEEACEDTGLTSGLAKYNAAVNKYINLGICPPCLAGSPGAIELGLATVAGADNDLANTYVCPGP